MAYIPPGPQTPFDKNRSYGQQPGFVSRNSGKIIIFIVVLIAIAAVAVITSLMLIDDDKPQDQATGNVVITHTA